MKLMLFFFCVTATGVVFGARTDAVCGKVRIIPGIGHDDVPSYVVFGSAYQTDHRPMHGIRALITAPIGDRAERLKSAALNQDCVCAHGEIEETGSRRFEIEFLALASVTDRNVGPEEVCR